MSAPKLTTKQRAFVEHYLANGFNATDAARRAGYAGNDQTLRAVGYENLTKPHIAELVEARLADAAMSADEALARLADIARGDMGDFLEIERVLEPVRGIVETPADPEDLESEPEISLGVVREEERVRVTVDLERARAAGKLHLLKRYAETKDGVRFELYDRQAALKDILQMHGRFKQAVEVSGPGGRPLGLPDLSGLSDAQLEQFHDLLEAAAGRADES